MAVPSELQVEPRSEAEAEGPPSAAQLITWAVLVAAAAIGVALRWTSRSALWLDEAQSVAFASLPADQIPAALREDGAPPLYYLVLHTWMGLVGDGDRAVRSLSAALSTVTVVVAFVIVRRRWGPRAALAAAVLLATSPFAIRYAAETRMYALVMLGVVLGVAAVGRALERPAAGRLLVVATLSGALLLSHYWALYLVVATTVVLLASARRASTIAATHLRVAGAVAAGFVFWLPWAPAFLFQSRHTATPWASPADASSMLQVFAIAPGGPPAGGVVLGVVVAIGWVLGVAGRTSSAPPSVRAIGLVAMLAVALGVAGAILSSSAASSRYLAISIPLVLVTASVGLYQRRTTAGAALLVLAALVGLGLSTIEQMTPRTTAPDIARAITSAGRAGDVVVICPDQLAPALHRLLDRHPLGLVEVVHPAGSSASRVNWIDYAERARRADAEPIVRWLRSTHPTATTWLVVSLTYPPTQPACAALLDELVAGSGSARRVLADRPDLIEHGALWRIDPLASPGDHG